MLNPLTHRKVLKKGMPGMATIVEMGVMDRDATSSNLPMTLQVHVEGITPYEVEGQWMVKAKDTVGLSGAIPVKVDPEDHDKVAIDWEGVRAQYEEGKAARQQALASGGGMGQMMGGMGGMGGMPDMAQLQQMAQGAEKAAGGGGDDPVAKLERLAALKDSGALTEKEFEREKKKLLGS